METMTIKNDIVVDEKAINSGNIAYKFDLSTFVSAGQSLRIIKITVREGLANESLQYVANVNQHGVLTVARKSVSGMKPGIVQVEYTFEIIK